MVCFIKSAYPFLLICHEMLQMLFMKHTCKSISLLILLMVLWIGLYQGTARRTPCALRTVAAWVLPYSHLRHLDADSSWINWLELTRQRIVKPCHLCHSQNIFGYFHCKQLSIDSEDIWCLTKHCKAEDVAEVKALDFAGDEISNLSLKLSTVGIWIHCIRLKNII